MRIAIVHDWLYTIGGAERVLKEILRCFPDADVFTLFDTLSGEDRAWLGFQQSRTSFLQQIPGIAGLHRSLLPLMPFAIEQFDLSAYDLVISSSYAVAKGVITGPDQVHVSYIHSPMRYAWDLQHQYLRESNGGLGLKTALARVLLHPIRVWDASSSLRPDAIVANSAYIARRIRKAFGRSARVIHPPVDLAQPADMHPKEDHFLTACLSATRTRRRWWRLSAPCPLRNSSSRAAARKPKSSRKLRGRTSASRDLRRKRS